MGVDRDDSGTQHEWESSRLIQWLNRIPLVRTRCEICGVIAGHTFDGLELCGYHYGQKKGYYAGE